MKRNKAKISGGLMTLKPVVRSGLRLQRGGRGRERERESGAAEPGDKRARGEEGEMDGEICVWSKEQSVGEYLEH